MDNREIEDIKFVVKIWLISISIVAIMLFIAIILSAIYG